MAFLCPVRIRRGKHIDKDISGRLPSIGRITGSSSIETLVRVGIEKENGLSPDSKMVVLHDFTPCVDDELEVRRGQVVNVLYQENDWVYVIAESGQEGFIPHSYCVTFGSQLAELALNVRHKKLPRDSDDPEGLLLIPPARPPVVVAGASTGHTDSDSYPSGTGLSPKSAAAVAAALAAIPNVHPFFKDPSGRYIVLYTFVARDENDVSVERGEFVTVLNREDPDWFWIVRSDGQEGFVPSAFVYPAEVAQEPTAGGVSQQAGAGSGPQAYAIGSGSYHATSPSSEDLRFRGSELVMLYDYKAQAPDDMSMRRGDWIYADLNNQTVDGWLWAYAPRTQKYGFIPKAYARPPAMTSL